VIAGETDGEAQTRDCGQQVYRARKTDPPPDRAP
jgi:hypothetical protein